MNEAPVPDPEKERRILANRLTDAGLSTRRFIDVNDGKKKSRNHTQHEPDTPALQGNYGTYAGHGLLDIDIDDYGGESGETNAGLAAIRDLAETLTIESPHTDGADGGHCYYAVETDRTPDDFDVDAVLSRYFDDEGEPTATYHAAKDDPVALAIAEEFGTVNLAPSWGEVRATNQYVVGPGSQIDGCDKDWCDDCAKPDGGYYRIADDREIATIEISELLEALRADPDIAPVPDGGTTTPSAGEANAIDTPGAGASSSGYDPAGADIEDVIAADSKLATFLATGPKAAEFTHSDGGPDRSTADYYACVLCIEHGVPQDDARDTLTDCQYSKVGARDASSNYFSTTWSNALDNIANSDDSTPNMKAHRVIGDGADETATNKTRAGWADVMKLFDSNDGGSTTRGYGRAAEVLDEEHSFATIRDTGELYYYEPDLGYYVRKGESFLDELLERQIPGYLNSSRRTNIRETVRARNYVDSDDFTPPAEKVCVRNGVLDLDTREMEPHSPEYYFTSRLQTPYIEDAEAPRWEWFLGDSVTPSAVRKLEQFIGYALETWHHDREKNLFIVGPRQSGKSTYADTVQELFGDMPTVSNLTPQQIADTQFDAASLKEAALNAVNDINATKIQDTGMLKRVFSGERLKLERKGLDPEFGAPKAKHLFSANWLPTVVGQDESFYRRVLIVEFPNKVDDDKRDLGLKDDLRDELPGILNRALDARDRLHEQDGFTNDRDEDETRRKWDSWLDAHKRFLYTQYDITGDSGDSVDKETYYQAYKEYSGRKGYHLKPKQGVTKSLQWVPEIEVRDEGYGGLEWRRDDAAGPTPDSTAGDRNTTVDAFDTTQDELVSNVNRWVLEFSTPTTPARRDDILEYAKDMGEDPERVSHIIDTLCEKNVLWKPEDGCLRQS